MMPVFLYETTFMCYHETTFFLALKYHPVYDGVYFNRCGALHVGDQLLSINNCILDNCTVWEATNYLISSDIHMELQIMPAHNFTTRPGFANCLTSDSVLLCQNSNMPRSRYSSTSELILCSGFIIFAHSASISYVILFISIQNFI